MRASFAVFATLVLGCGGRVIDGRHVESDASTDSAIVDTGLVFDTGFVSDTGTVFDTDIPEVTPGVCDSPVGSDFTCPAVETLGAKACTDVQIKAFMDSCFGDGDPSACSAARKKFASCGTCMLTTFITEGGFIEIGACMKKVKPTSKCAGSMTCLYDCWATACELCDPSPDGSGSSEYNECLSRQLDSGGSCGPFGGSEYESCVSDPDLSVCVPATIDDLLPFYRGACRDGGDWSKSSVPDGTL